MRLGGFWGLTAPMFVVAFPESKDALKLFNAFKETSNGAILKDLQKEFVQLQKISSYVVYTSQIELSAEYADYSWQSGGVENAPEISGAIAREITERVLAKIMNNEARGKFVDATSLEACISNYLASNSFQLSRIAKAVTEIIHLLPEATGSNCGALLQKYPLKSSVVDNVIVNGRRHAMTEDEKAIVEYYVSRMDDIALWVDALSVAEAEEEDVFGLPFSSLVRRKPESIRYAVLNIFEPVKQVGNAKMLEKVVSNVKSDAKRMKELYPRFVETRGQSIAEATESMVDGGFFTSSRELRSAGFDWSALTARDREILQLAYEGVRRVTPDALNKVFCVSVTDWDSYGEQLSNSIRVCGLNGCAERLFIEAVCNTVMSDNKIFRDAETIAKVQAILENDIDGLVATYLPVGEVISVE